MSRNRLITIVIIATAAVVCLWTIRVVTRGEQRINVLLITLDTTRADRLGCYGYKSALTPHLDRLSAGGVRFEKALCSVPITLPSHVTILTGLQPPEHGIRVNGETRLDPDIPTLAAVLQRHGYQTAGFIAAFALGEKFGLDSGFGNYDDDMTGAYAQRITEPLALYRPGALVVDSALEWLDAHDEAPFFCWVHLYDPHMPYYPHEALVGTQFAGQRSYDAEIAYMDMQVGRLMHFLQQRRLLQRTLVVAVGDHGEGLGDHGERDHGYMLYDSTLQVPLIISQPGGVLQGARVPTTVSLVDLFPTILDLLDIPQPREQSERSFKPALFGRQIHSRSHYAETDQPYASFRWAPLRCLITEQFKYIRTPRPELYDRRADPAESNNLAHSRPDVLAKMEAALAALESRMIDRAAQRVDLTAEEIQQLESLGYVAGGGAFDADRPDYATLPDIKDRMMVVDMDRQRAVLLAQGNAEQAVELCREIVRLAPESMRLRFFLGKALEEAGRLEEAVQAYRETLELEPDLTLAYENLGVVLTTLGRLDEAADCYTELLRLSPTDAAAHNNLAAVLIGLGKLDQAVEQLALALQLRPNHVDAHFNLARVRTLQKDYDQAVAHYQQVLRINPDRVDALNAAAWLLATTTGLSASQPDVAVQLAQRACELTGYQEPAVLDTLAAAHANAGDFTQAVSAAEQALTLASSRGQGTFADAIRDRVALYRAHRPYRQPPE